MIAAPKDSIYAARRLNIPYDEIVGVAPAWNDDVNAPFMMMHGPLPHPFVANCYLPGMGETTHSMDVKKFAGSILNQAGTKLRRCNDEQVANSLDKRFSDQGRLDAQRAVLTDWMGRSYVAGFLDSVENQFAYLLSDLMAICQPATLGATNAAAAVLDGEYRAILRNLPTESARAAYAYTLTLKDPDSPILAAVLRADPAASGISKKLHDELAMRHVLAKKPRELMAIWSAGAFLDAACYVIGHGT